MILTQFSSARVGANVVKAFARASNSLRYYATLTDFTISIILSGALDLIKDGLGTMTLSGANTYTGKTIVKKGTLATSTSNRIADASVVEVSTGAIFQLGGAETVSGLEGGGTVAMGANTLTLSGTGVRNFSGNITNSTGGQLIKTGTGSQELSGTSSINEILTHSGGILIFSGNLTTNKDINLCQGTSASPADCTITGIITQTGSGPQGGPRGFTVAQGANQVGTLTINGANISLFGGFFIGNNNSTNSVGAIVLNSGTLNGNGEFYMAGANNTFTQNGGTTLSYRLWISGGGNGTNNPSLVSVVNINGGTYDVRLPSALNQSLIIFGSSISGVSSTNTLNLNGGILKYNGISCSTPASDRTQVNTINFNGGTLDFDKGVGRALPMETPVGVTWNLVIKNGGAIISSLSGQTIAMAVAFSNDGGNGGLTKLGAGTLAMGSLAHSYNGSTSISDGNITRTVINAGTSPGTVNGSATFTNTTLSASFDVAPSIGMTFKFFPGETVQSYASVTLINASGRTGIYNSATSTLIIS